MNIPLSPTTSHTTSAGRIAISLIDWTDRMRTVTPDVQKHIEELAISIAENGLIHPPVIRLKPDGRAEGITGWCRTQACKLIGYESIDYSLRSEVDDAQHATIELHENLHRLNMTWQDNCIGVAKIHKIRKRLAGEEGTKWGMRETGKLLDVALGHVQECITVAQQLQSGNEAVRAATSVKDAIKVLAKQKEDAVTKRLATINSGITNIASIVKPQPGKKLTSGPVTDTSAISLMPARSSSELEVNAKARPLAALEATEIHLSDWLISGDSHEWMKKREPNSVDLILTDIPYGIDMENLDDVEGVDFVRDVHEIEENVDQMRPFLKLAFRVLRDKSYLIFFYDQKHEEKLRQWGEDAGFKVQPFPLLWLKPNAKNRAAHCNWPKCFEPIMVMRKGSALLRATQPTNYFMADGRAEKRLQRNPFAKPFAVLQWLINAVAVPGSVVLDPYAGGGSIIRACLNMGMKPIGIERDPKQFPHLLESIKQTLIEMTGGPVVFK